MGGPSPKVVGGVGLSDGRLVAAVTLAAESAQRGGREGW